MGAGFTLLAFGANPAVCDGFRSAAEAARVRLTVVEDTAAGERYGRAWVLVRPISVADFSFTSAGSTYASKNQPNGTLRGTKDGQYWNSWQLNAPAPATEANKAAETALQTLTALNTRKTPANTLAGVDISA